MAHGMASTKMPDTKPDQAESVMQLAQSIEHHQQHQLQYFQDVLDNTAKLLEEHRVHADAVRQEHQRSITAALSKILGRIEALEENIARVKNGTKRLSPRVEVTRDVNHDQVNGDDVGGANVGQGHGD